MTTAKKLVEKGSLLGITEPDLLFHPAIVETTGGNLYWVNQFPADQSHTHVLEYDKAEKVGEVGISFRKGRRIVAYLATYDQWPELNIDAYRDEKANWLVWLQNSANRQDFDEFVKDNRPETP